MRRLALVLALALLALPAGAADACVLTTSKTSLKMLVVAYPAPSEQGYAVSDTCQLDLSCIYSIWFYEEANGVAGLQRRDESVDDTCGGRYASDRLI